MKILLGAIIVIVVGLFIISWLHGGEPVGPVPPVETTESSPAS